MHPLSLSFFFFFNDTATTEIYTLSLHDALPISCSYNPLGSPRATSSTSVAHHPPSPLRAAPRAKPRQCRADRKSTRLNSSHDQISYAVFCLKKKKKLYHLFFFHQMFTINSDYRR